MGYNVKGVLFQDYVRMIRKYKDVDWGAHLKPVDFEILDQIVLSSRWYPRESYIRLGLAVFKELGKEDLEAARAWGRNSVDQILKTYKDLIEENDPEKTLEKLMALRRRLIDFDMVEVQKLEEGRFRISLDIAFIGEGQEPYAHQLAGIFERVLEMAGAEEVVSEIAAKSWEADPLTVIELSWK